MRIFILLVLFFATFIITSNTKKLKRHRKHIAPPKGARYAARRRGFRRVNASARSGLKIAKLKQLIGTYKKRSRRVRRKKPSLLKLCRILHKRFHICDRYSNTRKFVRSCGIFRTKRKIGYCK
ncbi:uncharacterized protein LOC143460612 isoform X3 [Clavelina lepadiformis]|uniref:uncharacterized protein LOC143460612 isoform X3 n=1 Tax=Clavelina lepadiformis TaxID=159417 RepID=UPI0040426E30